MNDARDMANSRGVAGVLVRGTFGSFTVAVVGTGLAFLAQVLLARLMGVSQYGIYIYAITWLNILALIAKLGLDTSLVRFLAEYNAQASWGLFQGILRRSTLYVLGSSIFIGISAACVVYLLKDKINPEQELTFWISFLILPFIALTALRHASLRALKHVVLAALPDSILRPILLSLLVLVSYFYFQDSLRATQVMALNLAGTIIALIVGSFWLLKALPKSAKRSNAIYHDREWLRVSLPLFLISGMYVVLKQTDTIIIGIMIGTEEAGIYAVVTRVAGLLVFGLSAVNAIAAPLISELYHTDRKDELQRMVTLAARGISVFTISTSVVLIVFGKYLLGLFGEEFVDGYILLLILLSGQLVNALCGSVGFLMTMTGLQNQAAAIIGGSALVNIILNLLLIPKFGMVGAAIATASTTALWNFAMLFVVLTKLKLNPTVVSRVYHAKT